jgi:hypothetical protein
MSLCINTSKFIVFRDVDAFSIKWWKIKSNIDSLFEIASFV